MNDKKRYGVTEQCTPDTDMGVTETLSPEELMTVKIDQVVSYRNGERKVVDLGESVTEALSHDFFEQYQRASKPDYIGGHKDEADNTDELTLFDGTVQFGSTVSLDDKEFKANVSDYLDYFLNLAQDPNNTDLKNNFLRSIKRNIKSSELDSSIKVPVAIKNMTELQIIDWLIAINRPGYTLDDIQARLAYVKQELLLRSFKNSPSPKRRNVVRKESIADEITQPSNLNLNPQKFVSRPNLEAENSLLQKLLKFFSIK